MQAYQQSVCTARARARMRSSRTPCPGSACSDPPALRTHAHRKVGRHPRTWLTPRCTVQAIFGRIAQLVTSHVSKHAAVADLDGDGELTLEDSKLGLSRVAPYVRRHPGLTGGFAGGFILAYRLI